MAAMKLATLALRRATNGFSVSRQYFLICPTAKWLMQSTGNSAASARLINPGSAAGRRCASCHLDNYAGTKGVARLAGQREDYLLKALRDYKGGLRSGGQAAMAEVAFPLHDEEIVALAHYLAHL